MHCRSTMFYMRMISNETTQPERETSYSVFTCLGVNDRLEKGGKSAGPYHNHEKGLTDILF